MYIFAIIMASKNFLTIIAVLSVMVYPSTSQILDDCSYVGECSKNCSDNSNTTCSCLEVLIATKDKIVHVLHQNNESKLLYPLIPSHSRQPISLTYDARRGLVYWIPDPVPGQQAPVVYQTSICGHTESQILDNPGIVNPRSVAFDWITGNLYYIDNTLSAIVACDNEIAKDCATVLQSNELTTSRILSILPNQGMMVWLELLNTGSNIYEAGMDGSSRRQVVALKGQYIVSMAADQRTGAIYWYGGGARPTIGSIQNGVEKDVYHGPVTSIDIYDDKVLFWSSTSGGILSIPKTGKTILPNNTTVEVKFDNLRDVRKISAYGPTNQPIIRANPCQSTRNFSSICVLSPESQQVEYRILCPMQSLSKEIFTPYFCNSTGCSIEIVEGVEERLTGLVVLASVGNVGIVMVFPSHPENIYKNYALALRQTIPRVKTITGVVRIGNDPRSIVVTDSKQIVVTLYTSEDSVVLVDAGINSIVAVGGDEIGENLYWAESNGSVYAMSIWTRKQFTVLENLGHICDMLVVADKGSLILALKNISGGIDIKNYFLDGSEIYSTYHIPKMTECIKLEYDVSGFIVWSNLGSHQIKKFDVIRLNPDGNLETSSPVILPEGQYPSSFGKAYNTTIWTDSEKLNLNLFDTSNPSSPKQFSYEFLSKADICKLKLKSNSSEDKLRMTAVWSEDPLVRTIPNVTCYDKNCSHVCLIGGPIRNQVTLEDFKCHCISGYKLAADGQSCEEDPESLDSSAEASRTSSDLLMLPIGLIAVAIIGGIGAYIWRSRRVRLSEYERKIIKDFREGIKESSSEYEKEAYDRATLEIPKDSFNINLSDILGSGQFGVVCKGLVKCNAVVQYSVASGSKSVDLSTKVEVAVAVKTCKPGGPSCALGGILSEIKIMSYLGKHKNIVGIVGAFTAELPGLVYMFVELCELGCLEKYVRREKTEDPPTNSDLRRWTHDIVNGMEFLAERRVVHMDLATRNVLLASDKTAKISDFGLSRRLYNYSEYVKENQEPLPWRWMAPESLNRQEFTEKSDVWSFGVTLWEIFSQGNIPFSSISWDLVFADRFADPQFRLSKPTNCDDLLYSIILKCWNFKASLRPTFTDLQCELNCWSFTTKDKFDESTNCYVDVL